MERLGRAMRSKLGDSDKGSLLKAVLGGAYIALGGVFMCCLKSQGMPPMVCGLAFSMGLLAVVATGAELLTGDALMVVTVLDGTHGWHMVSWRWVVVMIGNLIGSLAVALLASMTGCVDAVAIAEAKCSLPMGTLLWRGVMCNVLVCLAVWMASRGEPVTDKGVAVLLPVAAFVTCGFEHSVADMFLIPLGMMCGAGVSVIDCAVTVTAVLVGNMVGGVAFACLLHASEVME